MARIAGRRGRVYLGVTTGAAASPLTAVATWSIDQTQDTIDVTSMGDSTKQYVADLPDASGSWTGFYDDSVGEVLVAATDGLSRKWYCYQDLSGSGTKYWYGEIVIEGLTQGGGIGAAVTQDVTWKAASSITCKTT